MASTTEPLLFTIQTQTSLTRTNVPTDLSTSPPSATTSLPTIATTDTPSQTPGGLGNGASSLNALPNGGILGGLFLGFWILRMLGVV